MDFVRKRKLSSTGNQLDPCSKQKIKSLFDKKFRYGISGDWKLPPLAQNDCQNWVHPVLQGMKEELNKVKDKLSDKEIYAWHEHTKFMNIAGNVISNVKQIIRPELCTQAWCKFYEILSSYPLINHESLKLNTVHLCEAPGAFVTSLNHYLVSNEYKGLWTWLGSTLNPYYEENPLGKMIDDDRFIRESFDFWYFGKDNTGNLMDFKNLEGLLDLVSTMGDIHLVTADGSIDCQDDPGEQEQIVSCLHYCEALAGILILSTGGHMVIKKFTMFESQSISLMYILCCLFKEVYVYKPATSKSGNSEVYVVCLNFHGLQERKEEFIKFCKPFFENGISEFRFPESCLPPDFMSEHIRMCEEFTDRQMDTIKCNLDHYPSMSEQYGRWIETVKDACADIYINTYELRPIPINCRMFPFKKKKKKLQTWTQTKCFSAEALAKGRKGTFNDRQRIMGASLLDRIKQITPYKLEKQNLFSYEPDLEHVKDIEKWTLSHGKPVEDVQSSCFCAGNIIQQMNLLQKYQQWTEEVEDLVTEALSVLYSVCNKPMSLNLSEALQGHIDLQNVQQLDFVKEIVGGCFSSEKTEQTEGLCHVKGDYSSSEVDSQDYLLKEVIALLRNIQKGSSVVWIFSTCLLRWTAGVVYLLSQCFQKVLIIPSPSSSLTQALVCIQYSSSSSPILTHLETVAELRTKEDTLLETVPIQVLVNDEEFSYFLRSCNEYVIKRFINESLQKILATASE